MAAATDPQSEPLRDVPIGVTLERTRHAHRIAALGAALRRLERIANEAKAAGREVPLPLRAAQRTFSEERDRIRAMLAELDARLDGAPPPLRAADQPPIG